MSDRQWKVGDYVHRGVHSKGDPIGRYGTIEKIDGDYVWVIDEGDKRNSGDVWRGSKVKVPKKFLTDGHEMKKAQDA